MPSWLHPFSTHTDRHQTRSTLLLGLVSALLALPAFAAQTAPPAAQQAPNRPVQSANPPRQQPRQPGPRIRLSTLKPLAGKNVVIVGSGLPAGSQVTARLTAPNGAVTQESTRVQDGGRFRLTLVLPNPGDYTLAVRGQGLDQMRVLEVQPAPAPGKAPASKASQNPPQQGNTPATRDTQTETETRPAGGPQKPNQPASGTEK